MTPSSSQIALLLAIGGAILAFTSIRYVLRLKRCYEESQMRLANAMNAQSQAYTESRQSYEAMTLAVSERDTLKEDLAAHRRNYEDAMRDVGAGQLQVQELQERFMFAAQQRDSTLAHNAKLVDDLAVAQRNAVLLVQERDAAIAENNELRQPKPTPVSTTVTISKRAKPATTKKVKK